jgi:hypothetical protein
MTGQQGFFDGEERLARLSAAGDPLERLAAVVDFELFRPDLELVVKRFTLSCVRLSVARVKATTGDAPFGGRGLP